MRRDGIDGLRRLGLGLLVAGAVLTGAEQAPQAEEREKTRPERSVSAGLSSTCVLPSREPSRDTPAKETTAVTPSAAKCDEVPPQSHVLDGPRMTEC